MAACDDVSVVAQQKLVRAPKVSFAAAPIIAASSAGKFATDEMTVVTIPTRIPASAPNATQLVTHLTSSFPSFRRGYSEGSFR